MKKQGDKFPQLFEELRSFGAFISFSPSSCSEQRVVTVIGKKRNGTMVALFQPKQRDDTGAEAKE